jgi:hypothetical protein
MYDCNAYTYEDAIHHQYRSRYCDVINVFLCCVDNPAFEWFRTENDVKINEPSKNAQTLAFRNISLVIFHFSVNCDVVQME